MQERASAGLGETMDVTNGSMTEAARPSFFILRMSSRRE
jgi:hypothetical protein